MKQWPINKNKFLAMKKKLSTNCIISQGFNGTELYVPKKQ